MIHFAYPFNFFLLIFIGVGVFIFLKRKRSSVRFSTGAVVLGVKPNVRLVLAQHLWWLRVFALLLIVVGLCRPQVPLGDTFIDKEGIDIALVIDSSTSMLAEDFSLGSTRKNRITVIKDVVASFINDRPYDRIALVTFAGRAYTVCPLTLDHSWLTENLNRISAGMVEDGTAIGSGIASAAMRLKQSQAKNKVIILLTDGRNNAGTIDPLTAAEAAHALKIKIYTIGAGSKGPVPYPVQDFFGNTVYQQVSIDIDEDVLKKIAEITNGRYYRATDTQSLREIYKQIDTLEKTLLQDKGFQEYQELFGYCVSFSLLIFLIELVLSKTVLRILPE